MVDFAAAVGVVVAAGAGIDWVMNGRKEDLEGEQGEKEGKVRRAWSYAPEGRTSTPPSFVPEQVAAHCLSQTVHPGSSAAGNS